MVARLIATLPKVGGTDDKGNPCLVPVKAFLRNGVVHVSAEEGDNAADYYGELSEYRTAKRFGFPLRICRRLRLFNTRPGDRLADNVTGYRGIKWLRTCTKK